MKAKKGEFNLDTLLGFGMTLVVIGIAFAVGLQILGETKTDMAAKSYERNATDDTIEAISKVPSKLGLIVTVVVAAILISILMTMLYKRVA